jgi:flagellar biosynthesis/type III secretory pathway protein FliH
MQPSGRTLPTCKPPESPSSSADSITNKPHHIAAFQPSNQSAINPRNHPSPSPFHTPLDLESKLARRERRNLPTFLAEAEQEHGKERKMSAHQQAHIKRRRRRRRRAPRKEGRKEGRKQGRDLGQKRREECTSSSETRGGFIGNGSVGSPVTSWMDR